MTILFFSYIVFIRFFSCGYQKSRFCDKTLYFLSSQWPWRRSFWKHVGEKKKMLGTSIFSFSTMFHILSQNNFVIFAVSDLSSADAVKSMKLEYLYFDKNWITLSVWFWQKHWHMSLTLYYIDTHFDASITDSFWKHCGKRRNCS